MKSLIVVLLSAYLVIGSVAGSYAEEPPLAVMEEIHKARMIKSADCLDSPPNEKMLWCELMRGQNGTYLVMRNIGGDKIIRIIFIPDYERVEDGRVVWGPPLLIFR